MVEESFTPAPEPETWQLTSAEVDANGLTIDMRSEDGRTLSMSWPVNHDKAITLVRVAGRIFEREVITLGHHRVRVLIEFDEH